VNTERSRDREARRQTKELKKQTAALRSIGPGPIVAVEHERAEQLLGDVLMSSLNQNLGLINMKLDQIVRALESLTAEFTELAEEDDESG